jgi:hypothetical protein
MATATNSDIIVASLIFFVIGFVFQRYGEKITDFSLKYLDWVGGLRRIKKFVGDRAFRIYYKWVIGLGFMILGGVGILIAIIRMI